MFGDDIRLTGLEPQPRQQLEFHYVNQIIDKLRTKAIMPE
jgi:hypothetical protein